MQVHQETFGKSGCRRIVPGQYLAIEPKGRAVMIGEYLVLCRGEDGEYRTPFESMQIRQFKI